MFSRPDQSNDTACRHEYNIEHFLDYYSLCQCDEADDMLTLVFPVGTIDSAIFFLRLGSSFKQCKEEVLIARSNSSSPSNEVRKDSAPGQGEIEWMSINMGAHTIKQPPEVKVCPALKDPP